MLGSFQNKEKKERNASSGIQLWLKSWQILGYCGANWWNNKREKYAWTREKKATATKLHSCIDVRHYIGLWPESKCFHHPCLLLGAGRWELQIALRLDLTKNEYEYYGWRLAITPVEEVHLQYKPISYQYTADRLGCSKNWGIHCSYVEA